jgi:4-diphosphocytidyl-2-C-methyl-D-erythritol kinase
MRPDGYHEIETILHGVSLADEIVIEPLDIDDLEVEFALGPGLDGRLPDPKDNLITAAAGALRAWAGQPPGLRIRVTKNVPIAAGLGGGSANAAGILHVLNDLWRVGLDRESILVEAAKLGSDVPYCIGGGTALATSRGEKLTQLPPVSDLWFVLGVSYEPLLTREVYALWDEIGGEEAQTAPMTLALGSGDVQEIASLLHNDLEQPAFKLRPDLRGKKDVLLEAGALGALLSGSGPTVFGLAWDEAHARDIAGRVEAQFDATLVATSALRCIEVLS